MPTREWAGVFDVLGDGEVLGVERCRMLVVLFGE